MEATDRYIQFQKAVKYRYYSIIAYIVSPLFIGFGSYVPVLAVILPAIAIFLGWRLGTNYACPECGYQFDVRVSPNDLQYCMSCSSKLRK